MTTTTTAGALIGASATGAVLLPAPHAMPPARTSPARAVPATAAGSPAVSPARPPALDEVEAVLLETAGLPGRAHEPWQEEERRHWSRVVVPAAQQHALLAVQLATGCETRTELERRVAAVHLLMTLTLGDLGADRRRPAAPAVRPELLHAAYDGLEAPLPLRVRRQLPHRAVPPARSTATGGSRRTAALVLTTLAGGAGLLEIGVLRTLLGG